MQSSTLQQFLIIYCCRLSLRSRCSVFCALFHAFVCTFQSVWDSVCGITTFDLFISVSVKTFVLVDEFLFLLSLRSNDIHTARTWIWSIRFGCCRRVAMVICLLISNPFNNAINNITPIEWNSWGGKLSNYNAYIVDEAAFNTSVTQFIFDAKSRKASINHFSCVCFVCAECRT